MILHSKFAKREHTKHHCVTGYLVVYYHRLGLLSASVDNSKRHGNGHLIKKEGRLIIKR